MDSLKQQPISRNCFVCGVENPLGLHMHFFETPPDANGHVEVRVEYTVPAQYQGYPGVVHGGIIATMLDEVTSRTIFGGDPPRFVVTARLSVRYRKPVPVETPLRLTGRVVEDKGRVVTVVGEVHNAEGALLAEAEGVLMEVDAAFFGDMTTEDMLGWQVFPDGNENQRTSGTNQSVEER